MEIFEVVQKWACEFLQLLETKHNAKCRIIFDDVHVGVKDRQ